MTFKGKTWSHGTYSRLLFGVNMNLNLSNIKLEPLSVVNVLFYAGEDFVIVNHLILVAKFYNDCCKLNMVLKTVMQVLKTKMWAVHNIEGRIAFMWNKAEYWNKKWEKIKSHLNVI